jgi:hypothetical protein
LTASAIKRRNCAVSAHFFDGCACVVFEKQRFWGFGRVNDLHRKPDVGEENSGSVQLAPDPVRVDRISNFQSSNCQRPYAAVELLRALPQALVRYSQQFGNGRVQPVGILVIVIIQATEKDLYR